IGFHPPTEKFEDLDEDSADTKIQTACVLAVEDFFNPEFINRIDEIITFNRLKPEHMMAILDKFLFDSRARLAAAGVGVSIENSAKELLIEKGTNLRYGA